MSNTKHEVNGIIANALEALAKQVRESDNHLSLMGSVGAGDSLLYVIQCVENSHFTSRFFTSLTPPPPPPAQSDTHADDDDPDDQREEVFFVYRDTSGHTASISYEYVKSLGFCNSIDDALPMTEKEAHEVSEYLNVGNTKKSKWQVISWMRRKEGK